jgi:hypothetical protein
MSNIYNAISQCMAEIGAIGKDKKNTQGSGFMYRGIDDVMNALSPVMVNNKVFVVPQVLEEKREDKIAKSGGNLIYTILKIKFTFYTDDGSFIESIVIGEAMDSGDKSSNKAMSVAFKYACFQVFCIATEEMIDPDGTTHELKGQQPKGTPQQTQGEPPTEVKITTDQCKILGSTANSANWNLDKLTANAKSNYKVEKIEDLTFEQYTKLMLVLDGKIKKLCEGKNAV